MSAIQRPLGELRRAITETVEPRQIADWLRGHREPRIPHVPLTPAVAAKWLVDEWTLQVESGMNRLRMPTSDFRRRQRQELDDAIDMFTERGWASEPRTYHQDPPPLVDPELRTIGVGPFAFEHLTFDSGYAPHDDEPGRERWLDYEANRTVHAWVLRHDGPPRPWIVCVNGYRTGTPLVDLPAFRVDQLHGRLGLNVAVVVLPLHGPRREGRLSGDRTIFSGALNGVHAITQAVWDVRRVLSWVRLTQAAPSVGISGISLGGLVVSLVASLDSELACVIGGVPESDMVRGMRRHVEPLLPPFYEVWGLSWTPLERISRVTSPLSMAPLVPRERRFIYAGLADRWVRPANVYTLWEHWERCPILWYRGSHLSFPWESEVTGFVDHAIETTLLAPDAAALAN